MKFGLAISAAVSGMSAAKQYTTNKLKNLFIRAIAILDKSPAKIDYLIFESASSGFHSG